MNAQLLLIANFMLLLNHGMAQYSNNQSLGIGYFGEMITHPGWVISYDYELTSQKNQWLGRINLIYYLHQKNSHNMILLPELIFEVV